MAIFRLPPPVFVGGRQPDAPRTVSQPAAPTVGQTWDPAHTSSTIALSNGNLTATLPTGFSQDYPCFGVVSQTSGLYYWEQVVTTSTPANTSGGVGNVSSTLGAYLGSEASSIAWAGSGGVFAGGPQVDTWAAFASGNRLCFALDLNNHKIWGRLGTAGNWNNDVIGNQNPATNTGGHALNAAVYAGAGAVPGADVFHSGDVIDASFASGSWVGTAPSGFGPWVATTAPTATASAAIQFTCSAFTDLKANAAAPVLFTTLASGQQFDQASTTTPVLSFTTSAFTDLKANAATALTFTTTAAGQQFDRASATNALQFACQAFTDLKASTTTALSFTTTASGQQFDQASTTSALQFSASGFTDLKASTATPVLLFSTSAAAAQGDPAHSTTPVLSFTTAASGQQFDQASATSPIQFTCSAFTDLKARTTASVLQFTTAAVAGQSDQALCATPVLSFTCRAFTDLKANASAAVLFTTAASGQQFDQASATSALLFTCSASSSPLSTVPQAWDPAHTAGQITLSNGNLTASTATSPGFDSATYGIISKTSGKYYWEVVVTGNTTNAGAGVGNVGSNDGLFLGAEASSLGWFGAGGVFGTGSQVDSWAAFASGNRLCFALDLDNQKIWGRVGTAGNWNNAAIGSQNPATNTGGLALNAAVSAGFGAAPGGDVTHAGDQLDASFVSASWAGTAPSGFVAWPPSVITNLAHASPSIVFSASGTATLPNIASAIIVFWPEGEFSSEFGGEFASGRRVIATATQGTPASGTSAIIFSAAGNVSDWATGLSNIVFSAQSAASQRTLASAADTLLAFSTVGHVSDWAVGVAPLLFTTAASLGQSDLAVGLASANIQTVATAGQSDSVSAATPLLTFSAAGAVSDWSYGISSLQFSALGSVATVASATAKLLNFQCASTAVFGTPISAFTPLLTFNTIGKVSDWAFASTAVTFSANVSLGQLDQATATTPLLTFSAAGSVANAATARASLTFTCAATALRSQVTTAVATAPVFTTAAAFGQSDPVAAAANINFATTATSGQADPATAVSALQFSVGATAGTSNLVAASANINLAAAGSAAQQDLAAATVHLDLAAAGVATSATRAAASGSINFSSHATATCSTNASAVNNIDIGVHAVSSGIPTSAIITWPPITCRGSLGVFTSGSSHLVYFDNDDRQVYFGSRNDRAYSLLPTRRAA